MKNCGSDFRSSVNGGITTLPASRLPEKPIVIPNNHNTLSERRYNMNNCGCGGPSSSRRWIDLPPMNGEKGSEDGPIEYRIIKPIVPDGQKISDSSSITDKSQQQLRNNRESFFLHDYKFF